MPLSIRTADSSRRSSRWAWTATACSRAGHADPAAEGLRRQRRGVRLTGDRQNSESRRKKTAEKLHDDYISVEHLMRHLLREERATSNSCSRATASRAAALPTGAKVKTAPVTLGQSRGDLRRAQEIRHRPCRARPQQARSLTRHRPMRRSATSSASCRVKTKEQPCAHRRGRASVKTAIAEACPAYRARRARGG